VPSSVILGMRYLPEFRTLVIAFRGRRGTYRYFDVPMEEWTTFRASGSKGTYLNEVFKAKNYAYEKLADKPLVVQDEQRNANENNQAQHKPEFLEWGETWAFPKPRAQRGNADYRQ
jgi:hypothetical protein